MFAVVMAAYLTGVYSYSGSNVYAHGMIDLGDTSSTWLVSCPSNEKPSPDRQCSARVGWVSISKLIGKWGFAANT